MKFTAASFVLAVALAVPAFGQQKSSGDHVAHHEAAPTDGEVRKVDRGARKITIKHGPIQNLDMPAMTMVFQVKDPAMLDKVKAGDKVKFQAENLGGALTVTRIEAAR